MEDIKRMVSRVGFIETFWNRMAADFRNGGNASRQQIYENMEEEYEIEYGWYQFPSFDAFRKYLYRHIKDQNQGR